MSSSMFQFQTAVTVRQFGKDLLEVCVDRVERFHKRAPLELVVAGDTGNDFVFFEREGVEVLLHLLLTLLGLVVLFQSLHVLGAAGFD